MRIFLTGATGYIGGALARRWLADGHEVRALVRDLGRAAPLAAAGAACFPGDVTDRPSMREAMSGADWVVHAAAELDFRSSPARMGRVNAAGSENVASLAWKLGVGRVLAVSSMAVFGGSPADGSPADESAPPRLPLPSAYATTKAAGDAAFAAWASRGLALNRVYPSLVYGPPGKKSGAQGLLRLLLAGRSPAVVGADRVTRWIFVDDLVEGISRLIAAAPPGEDFFMTGDRTTVGGLVARACALGGVTPPRLHLSPGVAYPLVKLLRPALRGLGVRGIPTPAQIRSLGRHWNFDDSKARAALAWSPRTLDAGLPPTIAEMRSAAGPA